MYAVGVDVSKGKSTVAVLQSKKDIVMRPFDVTHDKQGVANLVERLQGLNGEVKVVMEHTGRYYECIAQALHSAGFYVSALNPLLIKEYGGNTLRKVKTDPADARKIARYALDNWEELRQYTPMDTVRYELKTLNRQFQLASKNRTAYANNLIALLEQTYPGARSLFDSPIRADGSQKWVDFVGTFWHVDCVAKQSLGAFTTRYQKWCRRHGYNFSERKAAEIYENAKTLLPLIPKSETSKLLVKEAVVQLNTVSRTLEAFRARMNTLAAQLPEYQTVMAMTAVGPSLGPQLMAEIGDLRRFAHQKSLVAFAGTDPGRNNSGSRDSNIGRASKRGSPYLRKTLFVIMSILLQLKPADDPVYQFLDKKRAEGKPYYVYMTAGGTKFLRIYYGRVRDCLKEKGLWNDVPADASIPVSSGVGTTP